MKMSRIFIVLLVFVAVLYGCSNKTDDETHEQPEKEEQEEKEPAVTYTAPLTGEEISEENDRRIVSVMVNNHPAARPQTGLLDADMTFEILAEGSITRFLALYQSEYPEVVGPVRSARDYYIDLANDYDSIYVFHGAIYFVYDHMTSVGIDAIDGASYDNDRVIFERASHRQAPHNSYVKFSGMLEKAEEKGYRLTDDVKALTFTDSTLTTDEKAESVDILYPGRQANETITYEFNEGDNVYERYDTGEQTIDYETEDPIEMSNLFIVEASHQVIDEEGRRAINLEDGGNGLLIRDGYVESVEWANEDGMIVPMKDGKQVALSRGKTWVNVVPTDPGIEAIVNIR